MSTRGEVTLARGMITWMMEVDDNWVRTIEEGVHLAGKLWRRRVSRLLIICAASRAQLWLHRLSASFRLGASVRVPGAGVIRYAFWGEDYRVFFALQPIPPVSHHAYVTSMMGEEWDIVILDKGRGCSEEDTTRLQWRW